MIRDIGSSATPTPREASPGFVEATVFHGGPVQLDPFRAIADLSYVPETSHRAILLVTAGSVVNGDSTLGTGAIAAFDGPGEMVDLVAGPDRSSLLFLIGTPIGEPVVFGGPFCMTSQAEVTDAQQRFRSGAMGNLAPSF
jgi:redox-sensitive bicupin YhaK (pirin superfamily)